MDHAQLTAAWDINFKNNPNLVFLKFPKLATTKGLFVGQTGLKQQDCSALWKLCTGTCAENYGSNSNKC